MIKNSVLSFILLFSVSIYGNQKIEGEWSNYCEAPFSKIYTNWEGRSSIELASSQIYIYVEYKKGNRPGSIDIFFSDVSDLGRGGIQLNIPWKSLDKSVPIGSIVKVNNEKANLYWYGFVDSNGRKIDVMSDFSTEEVNKLERCR